jgi:transcriptional regulator with XRE-family HTH domain
MANNVALTKASMSTSDWLVELGAAFRRLRLRNQLDQRTLSELSQVSVGTIKNLEAGKGSSLHSVIAIARALGKEDWLQSLAPGVSISPLEMLKNSGTPPERRRVRRSAP